MQLVTSMVAPNIEVITLKKKKNSRALALAVFLIIGVSVFCLFVQKKESKPYLADTSINLYELMEEQIDKFLERNNRYALSEAKTLAKTIQERYLDNFGVDLVNYYSTLPRKDMEQLHYLRKRLAELRESSPIVQSEAFLLEAELLREGFSAMSAKMEVVKTQILLVRYYAVLGQLSQFNPLVDRLLLESQKQNHLFFQCHFSLWKSKTTYNKKELLKVRTLALNLNLLDIYISASSTLVGLYEISNEDKTAILISREVLQRNMRGGLAKISLLQSFSLALTKEHETEEAIKHIDDTISMAKELDATYPLALSYIIKGLIMSKNSQPEESEKYFDLAFTTAAGINVHDFKYQIITMCNAYKAKNLVKQNKKKEALVFYKSAIEAYANIKAKNNYILAQLNEGIAAITEDQALSKFYLEAAAYNLLQAEINKDKKYSSMFDYN